MSIFSTPATKVIKYCMFISFLLSPTSLYTQVTFDDVTEDAGVELNYQCKGSAWGDFNNDGYLDLYVIAWGSNNPNALFWNHENGEFTNGTAEAGLEDLGEERRCVRLGDYNNDGFLDIFIGKNGIGALYRNNGNSTFTDVADTLGLNVSRNTYSAAWGDYDNDGDIDLYLCTTSDDDILFENDVDSTGVFIDVTTNAGIGGGNNARSVIWFDYNNDGYLDINEGIESVGPNILYKNNGNKTFTDETVSAGVPDPVQTLSTAAGDYNNDGWMDGYL